MDVHDRKGLDRMGRVKEEASTGGRGVSLGEKEWEMVAGVYQEKENGVLNEKFLGKLPVGGGQKSVDMAEENEKMRQYAYGVNSVTGNSRVLTMLMKLEEMGLKGNMAAIKEFMDRTVGKVADVQMVGVRMYQEMSDEQLLTKIKELKPKNAKLKGKGTK